MITVDALLAAGYRPEQIISCPRGKAGMPCDCWRALMRQECYPKSCGLAPLPELPLPP